MRESPFIKAGRVVSRFQQTQKLRRRDARELGELLEEEELQCGSRGNSRPHGDEAPPQGLGPLLGGDLGEGIK